MIVHYNFNYHLERDAVQAIVGTVTIRAISDPKYKNIA